MLIKHNNCNTQFDFFETSASDAVKENNKEITFFAKEDKKPTFLNSTILSLYIHW